MNPYCYTVDSLAEASIAYSSSGAICIKKAFHDGEIEQLRLGVERLIHDPGPFASEHATTGRFFEDYCNWKRIEEFRLFVLHSEAGQIASLLLSGPVQFFHDHVIVKSAGTAVPTPWHQDLSYFPIDAEKNVSFWTALDFVEETASPHFVEGSHELGVHFAPRKFDDGNVYVEGVGAKRIEDLDYLVNNGRLLRWSLEPGDTIAFNFKTLHGSPHKTLTNMRRAFVMRWVGYGSKYLSRQGIPPYPWQDFQSGQELPVEEFPVFGSDSHHM